MSGCPGANLLVGRVDYMTPRVAGNNAFHALNVFKDRLEAPETSTTEGGSFEFFGLPTVVCGHVTIPLAASLGAMEATATSFGIDFAAVNFFEFNH